jgi:ABC-2 type transport system ATP-binding protein
VTFVEASGVSKRFGRTRALDAVSVDAGPGVIGLLGPNGAGKTTLIRILATVLAPDRGKVRVDGLDPARGPDRLEIRRRLGYMPQEPGYYRNFSAFDFIDYVAILKEMTDRARRHAEVRRVIELVELDAFASKKIRALSGGMRRRVALAQALLGDPSLLVLDEPTAGLDPEQRLRFREMVSVLGEERTVVLSTHQTEDVTALCRDVIVLHGGAVRFRGTPGSLAAMAEGHVWLSDSRDPGARVAWRTGQGVVRNLGDAPDGATLAEPSIEDGYLLMVGGPALVPA